MKYNIILFYGPSSVGKTTLANRLKQYMKFLFISADNIYDDLAKNYNGSPVNKIKNIKKLIRPIMIDIIKKEKNKDLIIIDDNDPLIIKLLIKNNIKFVIVVLYVYLDRFLNNVIGRFEKRYKDRVIFELAELFKYHETCTKGDIIINSKQLKQFFYTNDKNKKSKFNKLLQLMNFNIHTFDKNKNYNICFNGIKGFKGFNGIKDNKDIKNNKEDNKDFKYVLINNDNIDISIIQVLEIIYNGL